MLYYLKLNIRELLVFRWGFVFKIIQRFISSLQLLFFWLIVTNFTWDSTVNSWSIPELMLLISFFQLNYAMFIIFGVGFFTLPYLVPSGRLDDLLILPIGTSKALIGDNLSPERFTAVITSIILLIFSLSIQDVAWPLVFFGILLALIGSILENLFFMTANLLSFWLGNMGAVVESLSELDQAKEFPLSNIPKGAHFVLTYMIPIVFVSSFPVEVMTKKVSGIELILGVSSLVALLILWIILFRKLWEFGLKSYQSGGSL